MNLYHWTQPGLPTDFVRRIVSDSWDNMSEEEKQVYEKQVSKQKPTDLQFLVIILLLFSALIICYSGVCNNDEGSSFPAIKKNIFCEINNENINTLVFVDDLITTLLL